MNIDEFCSRLEHELEGAVRADDRLIEDLGLDSLGLVLVLMSVESWIGAPLSPDDLGVLQTVTIRDLYAMAVLAATDAGMALD